MPNNLNIEDLQRVMRTGIPTIPLWARLEGRPRTHNFDRTLRVEVRDPLWMLARQWQTGEFDGQDAGSPVFSEVSIKTTELNKFQLGDSITKPLDHHIPLETQVEQSSIHGHLDILVQMGRYWLKMLKKIDLKDSYSLYESRFKSQHTFGVTLPQNTIDHAYIFAHKEVWQQWTAMAGRAMDGLKLYQYITEEEAERSISDIVELHPDDIQAIDDLGKEFVQWFKKLYIQPKKNDHPAWRADRLEYNFKVTAPEKEGEKVYLADEYYQGRLDWTSFDIDRDNDELSRPSVENTKNTITKSFIPTPIVFNGMPIRRWWEFENGKTNLPSTIASTTDIALLLFMEFALIYSNDWFLMPFTIPAGTISKIEKIKITDVFGDTHFIEAAGKGSTSAWDQWTMYNNNVRGAGQPADISILLTPAIGKIMEGKPFEEVLLMRDEMSNIVWGIEQTVSLAHGGTKPGKEAAIETVNFHKSKILPSGREDYDPAAAHRYKIATTIPEHWIPFMMIQESEESGEVKLQRAAMLRINEGGNDSPKIEPRTCLLREGLDMEEPEPYFIQEEEVPRAGIKVTQSFQRARWYDGRVFVWVGKRKSTGRGEGSSGLQFDQIRDVKFDRDKG